MSRLEFNFGTSFNPAKSPAPRQTQTQRCCGMLYRRWRFVGRRFPSDMAVCKVCGIRLYWPRNYDPKDRKKINRERGRDRSIRFLLQGLSTSGQPRRRHPNFVPMFNSVAERERVAKIKRNHVNALQLKNYRLRAKRLKEAGLTTRGTKPKYKLGARNSPLEKLWLAERSTMAVGIVSFEDFYRAYKNESAA